MNRYALGVSKMDILFVLEISKVPPIPVSERLRDVISKTGRIAA